jgi:hypothetical protein
MWGFYATMMTVCSGTVVLMLRKLAAPRVTPVVLAVTFVGWLTSLSVVALVPIDVYASLARREPGSLDVLWSISYWWARPAAAWAPQPRSPPRCRPMPLLPYHHTLLHSPLGPLLDPPLWR